MLTDGHDYKVVEIIVTVLEFTAPDFIFKVKGSQAFREISDDAYSIVAEEKAKGLEGVYDRMNLRVKNYWNEPLE